MRTHYVRSVGKRLPAVMAVVLCTTASLASAGPAAWQRRETDLRIAAGLRVRAIHTPQKTAVATQDASQPATTASGGVIPIDGFIPYIAVALTNKNKPGEFVYAHTLANSVIGDPLLEPMSTSYAIGTLDTGGTVNLIGYCDQSVLGRTADWLTGNTIPVGGVGGQIDADVTQPLGIFVAGLQAIDPTTKALDTTKLLGHWHVSAAIPQEPACGDIVDIPTAIGTPLLAFRDVVIRNDHKRTLVRGDTTYTGPEVSVHVPGDPTVPSYKYTVSLDVRPTDLNSSTTTSAYYPALLDSDFRTPWIPTALATAEGGLPTGGWFVASVWLKEGIRTEINKYFMVDTGAQISLVRSFVAGQLGLDPANPEFTVEVVGVAGDVVIAPGFYLDSLKLDATPDQVQFSQVPVIILDVPAIEGGTLDGIVGTNAFYNRNLAFKPQLGGNSVIQVSGPVAAIPNYGDFDSDGDVDLADFGYFRSCFNGPNREPTTANCTNADADQDGDVDLSDFGMFSSCFNGPNRPPACP